MSQRGITLPRLFSWVQKGGFAILDQGLFAGAHFIINIMLARWLEPAQYGAFAVAYSVFLLLAAFHTAVLTEPMMVFGAGKYAERFRKYLAMLIYGHLSLMVPLCIILLSAALVLGNMYSKDIGGALLALSLAGPMILLLWLLRRALYVRLQPGRAALGGVFYLVLLVGVVYLLQAKHELSPATAFLGMGFSALMVSILLVNFLCPEWVIVGNPRPAMAARDHWRYGRWSIGTAGLIWIPGNIYFLVLPAWIGLDGIAALRALLNLAMPVLHAIIALSSLLLPLLSRQFSEGINKTAKTMGMFMCLFVTGSIVYLIGLVLFRSEVLSFLYGDKYLEYSHLILLVGLLPFGAGIAAVLGGALRAMQRPDKVFWSYVSSSAVALVGGLVLVEWFGIDGAIWGIK